MSKIFILAACLFVASVAGAQPWMDNLPPGRQTNFYDIQRSFNQYWQGKDHTQKGKGWKQFKRWEWFWEQRVYPTGELPNPMQLYDEYEKVAGMRGKNPDAAGSWIEMGPSSAPGGYFGIGRIACVRVDPTNSSILWAGAPAGGLWKSTNSGSTWSTMTDELPTLGVTDVAIDPTNTNVMYIGTGDGDAGDTYSVGVLKSTNGGTTWNTTGLNWTTSQARTISRVLIQPGNSNILLASGSGIYRSTNGGTTWTQTHSSTHKDLDFKPGNPNTVYASTSGGTVRRSTDGGSTWATLSNGIPTSGGRVALGVTPANTEFVYALYSDPGNSGMFAFYKSTDAGTSWTSMAGAFPNLLGWSTTGSDTGGQGWYDLAVAVSQTDANTIFIGGVNNWKSTNGGAAWTNISTWGGNVHADQHDLYFAPGTNTLYAGNDGGVYRTTNNGSSWSWIGNGIKNTQFYKMAVSQTNSGRIIAGAQDNGTKYLNSGTWSDKIGGDGFDCFIDYSNANVMWGSLYYGDLYKSTNSGSSFSYISGGVSESGGWLTPYVQDPNSPNTIIAGYTNVWKTTNAGTSWTQISTFGSGSLDVVAVAPSNSQVMYVANGAALRRTTDGGTNWPAISTPSGAGTVTSIAINPSNSDILWVTSSGYTAGNKVWKSTNGGTSWTNISGTLPNVPTNTIVYENGSQDRLYVGNDIGVYYRDLNTADWQDFNTGLANVVISDLEIQYSAGKIRAGTYGRGVWESSLASNGAAIFSSTPDSISVSLAEGDSTTRTITITNNGTASLTWTVQSGSPANRLPVNEQPLPGKGEPDFRVGDPVLNASGGPDNFGYRWTDSDESGGPVYSWIDISGVGTAITAGQWIPSGTFGAADDGYFPVSLPFGFSYYGITRDTVFISTNGNVRLTRPDTIDYTNASIPGGARPNSILAAFWDDLNLTSSGTVHYYHDTGNSRFIIQYTNAPPYSGTGSYTFEVILNSNGEILFQYSSMAASLTSATIGIENSTGSDGLQVAFNTTYMHTPLAILFRNSTWLTMSPSNGTIPASNQQNITVKLKATGTGGTSQHASILIYSNDPLANPKTIPATVDVFSTLQTVNVPVAAAWNLVSVPLGLTNYLKTAVFPTAISQAYRYTGTAYQAVDTLRNEAGYWLKFPSAQNVQLSGLAIAQDTVSVLAEWNIIGSISQPVPVSAISPLGTSLRSSFYRYTSTGFEIADTLFPGLGYWIKVSTPGQLILKPNGPAPGPATGKTPSQQSAGGTTMEKRKR